jgi:hypothetical protein
MIIQEFIGYVEDMTEDYGTITLYEKDHLSRDLSLSRIFDSNYLRSNGITEEGDAVELTIVLKDGTYALEMRKIGNLRKGKWSEQIFDISEFASFEDPIDKRNI